MMDSERVYMKPKTRKSIEKEKKNSTEVQHSNFVVSLFKCCLAP